MKMKEITASLDNLFGKSRKKKLKEKHLEQINGLITMLEKKKVKVEDRLDDMEAVSDIPRYKRKLKSAELHLARARQHKLELETG